MPTRVVPAQLTPTSNHETTTPLGFAPQGHPPSKSPSPTQDPNSTLMSHPYSVQQTTRSMVSAESPTSARRKGARGPGKKEPRERPTVSVRWEEGDMTDRLIDCIFHNERWVAVFAQAPASGEGFHPRPGLPGVPKRDLHREIARHLFAEDARYAGNDKTQWEALAVSVKNKLFKLQGLYNDCRTALGDLADMPADVDHATLTPEQLSILSQVREKFPQFWRLRDILARLPAQGTSQSPESTRPGTSSASGIGQFYAGPSLKRKSAPSLEDIRPSTRPAPFTGRPNLSPRAQPNTQGGVNTLPSFLTPSPPRDGPSIADILGQLVERLDQQNRADERRRQQARERWLERELQEREKQREHEREMMKLRIQLARARGESQAQSTPVDEPEPEEEDDLLVEAEDGSEDAEGERDDSYLAADDAQDTPMG
ncbi:hypothetical protein DACRYDRAFT_99456 [Dacryopinax primogenitus]|uniref:Uncharacterized protein n=1 Tax=Dacryopinax primogenitus (strain DJM 731) TaxID=1858805 RepID=M5FYC0_DACPD|nr:uncharacterized protein DACRYDRAFT_99456 [Dacryopinax primogenitus]EJU03051.1 hypothetical protein DACRYDRAFT_99456 [Dacryopinax primogenitus]